MNRALGLVLMACLCALVASCASVPRWPPPEVVRLQNELNSVHGDPRVAANGDPELQLADTAVADIVQNGRSWDERFFRHRVYVADRMIQTAEAAGLARYAEHRGTELGAERDRLMVDAKTREAQDARLTANAALAAADAERRNADAARADAAMARGELDEMRDRITELQTRRTERGLVVTLGDVLFEVDRAALKPGAERSLDQLVLALQNDRATTVAIEGHTDSTGGRDHNVDLSQRRADAVKAYLVMHGVSPARVSSRGLGPDYPVASNGTEAGRQQNRRVEVVVQTNVAR